MDLGEYITIYRKEAGLTIDELAMLSGVPKGTINKIIAGTTKSPTLETVQSLAAALGKSINDFVDSTHPVSAFSHQETDLIKKYRTLNVYDKELVKDVLEAAYKHTTQNINPEDADSMRYIKCYELPASAGTGEPLGDTYYTDTIQVPAQRLPRNAHMCIRVHGNSMEPAYRDGDVVFVQHLDGESLRQGEIGIFVLNGEGYIKRLGHGVLESLNPDFDPIVIRSYDNLRCQGRVLGKL